MHFRVLNTVNPDNSYDQGTDDLVRNREVPIIQSVKYIL